MGGRLGGRSSVTGGGGGGGEDGERIRREYEFKIATMQTRITTLERDLEDAQLREQKWAESELRVRDMEAELEQLRRVSEGFLCLSRFPDVWFPARRGKDRRNALSADRASRASGRPQAGAGTRRQTCTGGRGGATDIAPAV